MAKLMTQSKMILSHLNGVRGSCKALLLVRLAAKPNGCPVASCSEFFKPGKLDCTAMVRHAP
jgi:hypothetical protein